MYIYKNLIKTILTGKQENEDNLNHFHFPWQLLHVIGNHAMGHCHPGV